MKNKKKILVIDDEADFTKLIRLNLEQTGKFEVRTENRGSAAWPRQRPSGRTWSYWIS